MSVTPDRKRDSSAGLSLWRWRRVLSATMAVVLCVYFLGCSTTIFHITSPRAKEYHVITTERLVVGPEGVEIVLDPPLRKGIGHAAILLTVPVRLDCVPYDIPKDPEKRDFSVRVRNESGVIVLPSITLTSRKGKTYTHNWGHGGFSEEYGESYISINTGYIPKGEALVKLRLEANEEFPCTKVEWRQYFSVK